MNERIREAQAAIWACCIQAYDESQQESRPEPGPGPVFCPVC